MNAPVPLAALSSITLDDKYDVKHGRVFMTAVQALVRLPMLQRELDRAAGLTTGGFISGYRGSPLGGVDQALWNASRFLEPHDIQFQPGINEDLAATAVWGSQQVTLNPAKVDGVFGMWYGKAPGVDRSIDAMRHANAAGTSQYGGVLAIIGDDHAMKSSTLPNQSDQIMAACMIPVLYPANVQEYLDFGLHGWAMSRWSGLWVGFKCVAETVESSASVEIDPQRVQPTIPKDFILPPGGLNLRWPDPGPDQEARLLDQRLPAALAYVRANKLDRIVLDAPKARLGIVCAGKAYLDVREALDLLGIDTVTAATLGLRIYKLAMVWPLEPEGLRIFAQGLEEILVIEEKRAFIETQVKELLYDLPGSRPRVIGKFDERGAPEHPEGCWLLPAQLELSPVKIATVVLARLERLHPNGHLDRHRARMPRPLAPVAGGALAQRIPYFCSGCPHNTSTNVPEGSRAIAGIGCHAMVNWMDRRTATFTHMGGEGVPWIGQARFSKDKHVFANLGDGTYFHSGYLAVRAAVAAAVPITYKILFNDAVAMTGGQQVDGQLTVPQITRQVAAEGVKRIVVVTDEPDKYKALAGDDFASGVSVHHRDTLDAVQRDLREYHGVSVLVYDQTCASEKRRRRKRGEFPDPARRVVINELVCEGCGDCSVQSNCLSVEPLETDLGRKRTINQSTCNKDFSCLKGFCPSFVTVEGGQLRKPTPVSGVQAHSLVEPPPPILPKLKAAVPYDVLITGVGGTGVVTIGALLGMAAHIEGRGVSVLDMTGLAQKGGAVMSHVRIAEHPDALHAARVASGGADLLIGGDLLVSASPEVLARIGTGRTRAVVNTAKAPTADFVKNADWQFPEAGAEQAISRAVGSDAVAPSFVDARAMALALLGDAIYANPFMLGFSFQKGWIPLSLEALLKAIELNRVSVERNMQAFTWGRRAAHDLDAVKRIALPAQPITLHRVSHDLDGMVRSRETFLTEYQNAAYAARYRALVDKVRAAEASQMGGTRLAEAVARYAFKLMAYKDEYEVARLYTDGSFRAKLAAQFEGDYALKFHLAPPILNKPDPVTGIASKRSFGGWVEPCMRVLARLRFLRGTAFDPFGRTEERRIERQLITDYERLMNQLISRLDQGNHALALELARIPEQIRGYGHVKLKHLAAARKKEAELMARWQRPGVATATQAA